MVSHKRRGGRELYVIRISAGPDQIQMLCREAAIAHAVAFAQFAHLGAWISDEAVAPVLLASFRDDAPAEVMVTERRWRPVAI